MRIEIHPGAIRDLDDAADWYEARRLGLGSVFVREVSRAFEVVSENPRMWPVWPGWRRRPQVRRVVLQRFPFSIAYIAQRQRVLNSRRRSRTPTTGLLACENYAVAGKACLVLPAGLALAELRNPPHPRDRPLPKIDGAAGTVASVT